MKKILSLVLALTLLFTNMLPVLAETSQSQTKISLEKAIEIAKNSFNINTEDCDFNQSYYENIEGTKQWQFNWNSRKNSHGISINVDAETGDVLYMSQWKNESSNPSKLAKYKKEEASKKASARKIQGDGPCR